MTGPTSTRDLLHSERRLVTAMRQLGFGRFERLKIERGQMVLDPWPTTVRDVKFCAKTSEPDNSLEDFLLKQQVVELLDYVRRVDLGEIRTLQVKNGLPFAMEVEHRASSAGGCDRG